MKGICNTIGKIIGWTIFVVYIAIVVTVSVMVLNRNQYNYTTFGGKTIVTITKEDKGGIYPEGSLLIVEQKKLIELKVGDKILIYDTDAKNNTVSIVYTTVKEIVRDESSSYLTIEDDGSAWGEEFIAGTVAKSIPTIGKILDLLESKWIFFFLLVVPLFFVLLYEVYLIIIAIKYGEDEEIPETLPKMSGTKSEVEALKEEIEKLKNVVAETQVINLNEIQKAAEELPKEVDVQKETKVEMPTPVAPTLEMPAQVEASLSKQNSDVIEKALTILEEQTTAQLELPQLNEESKQEETTSNIFE